MTPTVMGVGIGFIVGLTFGFITGYIFGSEGK